MVTIQKDRVQQAYQRPAVFAEVEKKRRKHALSSLFLSVRRAIPETFSVGLLQPQSPK